MKMNPTVMLQAWTRSHQNPLYYSTSYCVGPPWGRGPMKWEGFWRDTDKLERSSGGSLCWAVWAQVLAELVISQWARDVPMHCHCCPWHRAGGSCTHSEPCILWGQQDNMPALQPWEQPHRSCSQGLQRVQTTKSIQSDKAVLRSSWKVESRGEDLALNQQGTWPSATAGCGGTPSKGSWCL